MRSWIKRMYETSRHIQVLKVHFDGDAVIKPEIIESVMDSVEENSTAIYELDLVSEEDYIKKHLEALHHLPEMEADRFLSAYHETWELAVREG